MFCDGTHNRSPIGTLVMRHAKELLEGKLRPLVNSFVVKGKTVEQKKRNRYLGMNIDSSGISENSIILTLELSKIRLTIMISLQ
eukprot:augustus_masked-scaffold_17-processed-gene-4.38-mRNA-1 protein AED:1.00 eAED:1.00 QI:0/-1/0/0/-1/1/1/0/83